MAALSPADQVRLLIAAPGAGEVFTDDQVTAFLAMEGEVVKLAAARALGVIAVSEALIAKVIKDGDLSTDGAKLSAELRAQAKELRESHATELADSDDGFYFEVVDLLGG